MAARPSRAARAAGLALAVLTISCGGATGPARNLVLVSIDTLRPDVLGAYGYPRATSPTIDQLAAGGVLFEQALSTSPWTLPAHGSLLTGLYPSRHGMKTYVYGLPDGVRTLAQRLAAVGFETAAFVNTAYLGPRYGWDQGFDDYDYVEESVEQVEPSPVLGRAAEWLARDHVGRWFLFVHVYDVHSDYRALPRYEAEFVRPYEGVVDGSTEQLQRHQFGKIRIRERGASHLLDRYVAGVRQTDDALAALLTALEQHGLAEETLVVLTSDHGEEFLEHGGVLHGRTQYEEVLRIPLVLRGPGIPAGVRVAEPVSLVDVAPTVLSLLGLSAPDGLDGRDLSPLWRGEAAPGLRDRALFGQADHGNQHPDVRRAVRRGRFKLILDRVSGESALYDLEADPGETRDVAAEHPEVAAELHAELEAFSQLGLLGRPREPLPDMPEDELRALRALGYL